MNAPHSTEGHAAWEAGMACLQSGFSHADLDMGAALVVAAAHGVPASTAAPLLAAFSAGLRDGAAKRAERVEGADEGEDQPDRPAA